MDMSKKETIKRYILFILCRVLFTPNFHQQQTIAQLFAKVYEDIKLRHSQSSALVYDYIHLQYG